MALDPYAQLGVPRNAKPDDIEAAWRKLRAAIHPDKNPDDPHATARFQLAKEAYEILSDPVRRRAHDENQGDEADLIRRAVHLMTMIFDKLLNENVSNVIAATFTELDHVERNAATRREASENKIKRLESQLRRYHYKGAREDIMAILLTNRLEKERSIVQRAKWAFEEAAVVRTMLQDYEVHEEEFRERLLAGGMRYVTWGGSSGTGSTS